MCILYFCVIICVCIVINVLFKNKLNENEALGHTNDTFLMEQDSNELCWRIVIAF